MVRLPHALLLSAFTLSFSVVACAVPAAEDTAQVSSSLSTDGQLTDGELAATKAEVRRIALANTLRQDNLDAVRAELDPLVDRLARHFGARPATAKLPLVAGAWRQMWSDFPYQMNPILRMDAAQIYQVVSSDGYYYNLGDDRAFGFLGLTGVLRGEYTPDGARLRVAFTDVGYRLGLLRDDDDLVRLASDIEGGCRGYFRVPGGGRAPRGPVGIRGTLETVYVDGDLRIERGTQDDFVDDAGAVVVPGVGVKLFVLERVETPIKS
jgi:hypothetical protein